MSPLATLGRVLTFRFTREDLLALDRRHLGLGLLCTWLAGIGRYWDHADAHLLQHLGLGSVAYVFVLAAIVSVVGAAIRSPDWTFRRVLTFIALTSPPALLYAIPVERFLPQGAAVGLNVGFLATVAIYRVALLFGFVRTLTGRNADAVFATFLPITAILFLLMTLNLENATFAIMAGVDEPTPADATYEVITLLALLSVPLAAALLLGWLALAVGRWLRRHAEP